MQTFDVQITSTGENFDDLTLLEMVAIISEHFAVVGADYSGVIVTDHDSHGVLEVLYDKEDDPAFQSESFEKIFVEKFNREYTVAELLELAPHLS